MYVMRQMNEIYFVYWAEHWYFHNIVTLTVSWIRVPQNLSVTSAQNALVLLNMSLIISTMNTESFPTSVYNISQMFQRFTALPAWCNLYLHAYEVCVQSLLAVQACSSACQVRQLPRNSDNNLELGGRRIFSRPFSHWHLWKWVKHLRHQGWRRLERTSSKF